MEIRRNFQTGAANVLTAAFLALMGAGCACNCNSNPPAGLEVDPRSVRLIMINEAGVPVKADAVFSQMGIEVRRTTRFLAENGQDATTETLPTLADTLTIEAVESANLNTAKVGDPIASATFIIGKDFVGGDTVTFIIRKNQVIINVNRPPAALTLPEITVPSGASVTLDASGSTDPDNDPLTFTWTQLSGPAVTLDNSSIARPTFTAPIVPIGQTQSLSFSVEVKDPSGESSTTTVRVLVVGPAPISITLGVSPPVVPIGGVGTLSSTVSGGAGPYSYVWDVIGIPGKGSPGQIVSPTAASTAWAAPSGQLGTWTFRLTVTDSQGNQNSATISVSTQADCNTNGIDDAAEIASGAARDCDNNGVPDACDLAAGAGDCNTNGLLDSCELAVGLLHDCDHNGVIDECDPLGPPDCPIVYCDPALGDCNGNHVYDACDILLGTSQDCNNNGIPDECDIANGQSEDLNENGIPDECEGRG